MPLRGDNLPQGSEVVLQPVILFSADRRWAALLYDWLAVSLGNWVGTAVYPLSVYCSCCVLDQRNAASPILWTPYRGTTLVAYSQLESPALYSLSTGKVGYCISSDNYANQKFLGGHLIHHVAFERYCVISLVLVMTHREPTSHLCYPYESAFEKSSLILFHHSAEDNV